MKLLSSHSTGNGSQAVASEGAAQGARRATGSVPSDGRHENDHINAPDPEVPEIKPRRRFTAAYKLRILDQADRCTQPGQIGALLRSEGLYSSNLSAWRRQRAKGLLNAMAPRKRGRKKNAVNPLAPKVATLEKETRRLQQKLRQATLIIEAQKKISQILGIEQNLEKSDDGR